MQVRNPDGALSEEFIFTGSQMSISEGGKTARRRYQEC